MFDISHMGRSYRGLMLASTTKNLLMIRILQKWKKLPRRPRFTIWEMFTQSYHPLCRDYYRRIYAAGGKLGEKRLLGLLLAI